MANLKDPEGEKMKIRTLRILYVQKMMIVALILALMATPGLSGGRDVAAQGSSPMPSSSGETVELVTDEWWAVVRASIEEDLALSGITELDTTPNLSAIGEYDGEARLVQEPGAQPWVQILDLL